MIELPPQTRVKGVGRRNKLVTCVRCVCVCGSGRRGWRGGEWMSGLSVTIPVKTWGVLDMCVFGLRWYKWGVGWGLGPGSGAVGWCYVCVRCESGFSV